MVSTYKCWYSFLFSWVSSTLTLQILNPHAKLYLKLCLFVGLLGLKVFTCGSKSGKFYPYFIQPYSLTHCFYLLSLESSEYEKSLIPSDTEPKQIILGLMAFIKAVPCGWRHQQNWTHAIWARQPCWHQWSLHFPATTWISQSFSSWGLGSESLFSLNKIVSRL